MLSHDTGRHGGNVLTHREDTMNDIRESSFECRFDSASGRRVGRIRAWDAKEAVQLFVIELRADGVEEAGEVEVEPVSGGPRSRARVPRHRAA